jgi:hypothetical protein
MSSIFLNTNVRTTSLCTKGLETRQKHYLSPLQKKKKKKKKKNQISYVHDLPKYACKNEIFGLYFSDLIPNLSHRCIGEIGSGLPD